MFTIHRSETNRFCLVAASLLGSGGTTIAIPSYAIKTALEEFRGPLPKK